MMRKHSTILIFYLFVIFLYGCTSETEDLTTKKDVTIHELLTINEDLNKSPLFAFVFDAASDSQKNVYFVDHSTQNIHSFDSDGSYRWSIGGRGQGPGEFQFITSIYVDNEDRLFVYDSERAIITIFDNTGEIIDNRSFDFGRKTIENIRMAPNNLLLLPYWDEGKLIHLYSLESGKIMSSLVDFSKILQSEDEIEEELFQTNPGSAISLNERLIAYVPNHYAGKLYLFEETSSGSWQLIEVIEGYKHFDPSITFHVTNEGSHDRSHFSSYNSRGGGTYVHYEFHSMSFGLYPQADGSIIHLSYQAVGEEMYLVVENFDIENNQLRFYSIIDDLGIGFRAETRPVWMDSKGLIYFADNTNVPELKLIRLDYD